MNRSTDRILTTHVGSLPRPDGLEQTLTEFDRETLDEQGMADLPGKVRAGVASIVERQLATGIDIVSDGEASKYGYATYVKQRLTGLEGEDIPISLSEFADFPEYSMKTALVVTNPACTGP